MNSASRLISKSGKRAKTRPLPGTTGTGKMKKNKQVFSDQSGQRVRNSKVGFLRASQDAKMAGWTDLSQVLKDPKNVYIGRQGVVFCNGKRFPPHGTSS